MTLDIVLIILGTVLVIVGIVGCILPALPGVSLSYLSLILLHFTSLVEFSTQFLVIWALVVIVVQIMDYYIPVWGTKKLGGGPKGAWGSTIGVFAGMFIIPPWGIIICPFVGAVIGELIDGKKFPVALKAGFGAFVGFLSGTLIKLVVAIILAVIFFKEVITVLF